MDPELAVLTRTAGAPVVAPMATDAWRTTTTRHRVLAQGRRAQTRRDQRVTER
ncbi:hypothetical protein ACIOC1_00965 [Streptomyces sp. NPDC088197]|uniref:hypothetical protein n=1 Tax=Streptomyces sp. NPDC088197 TaxID=3365840 RepID=UPI0037F78E63